jgi:RNA polymerase sigma-70 factor (ECF subfamily)
MPGAFPNTPNSLISQLRDHNIASWQVSWKQFLSLYHEPIRVIATGIYRKHTGGSEPGTSFIEEAIARVVAGFFSKNFSRFDRTRGRLHTYLRLLINACVVDMLREERPLNFSGDDVLDAKFAPPAEDAEANAAYHQSLLATLIEDLRNQIPFRQFEIFELVKLNAVSPENAAARLGVRRGVIDNTIHKVMNKLRALAAQQEYQEEFYA